MKLSYSCVDIWLFNLQCSNIVKYNFIITFSYDEIIRLKMMKSLKIANQFIVSRGMLRKILSYYLPFRAKELVFQYSDKKKPFLNYMQNPKCFNFNVSHSRDLGIIAVSNGIDIGIDVEFVRNLNNFNKISSRFFSKYEFLYLKKLKYDNLKNSFFKLWTAKEAILKACGNKMNKGLNNHILSIKNYPYIEIVNFSKKINISIIGISSLINNYIISLAGKINKFGSIKIYTI